MEKKRVVPIWVSVVLLVLLVAGIVLSLVTSIGYASDKTFIFVSVIDCLACVLALAYCLKGYSKNSAKFFMIFCIFYCVSCALPIFSAAKVYQGDSAVATLIMLLHLLVFACTAIFAVARDLGKTKSMTMTGIILACTLINFTITAGNGVPTSFIFGLIGKVILAVVFFIMVYAKYKDKEARGTK